MRITKVNETGMKYTFHPYNFNTDINLYLVQYLYLYVCVYLSMQVYYEAITDAPERTKRAAQDTRQYDLVGPEESSHTLKNLKIFRKYKISVTAYNIAGEGPPSLTLTEITKEGGNSTSRHAQLQNILFKL